MLKDSAHADPPPLDTHPGLPFFHPTRVVFVDDDPRTLRSLAHLIANQAPVACYESGTDLMRDVEEGALRTVIDADCFTDYTGLVTDPDTERVIGVDKTMVIKRLFSPERFSTMGVVVIDYAMPDLDGFALCRMLEEHARHGGYTPARRIMLTAQADATLGIEAVNAGLIAAFYRKDRPDLPEVLSAQIKAQQRAFIAASSGSLRSLMLLEDPALGDSPEFTQWFEELCELRGIVEYYAVFAPGRGFLLLNERGEPSLILLYSGEDLSSQYEAARKADAPLDVLEKLKRRTHALYFADEDGTRGLAPDDWRQACIELAPFPGRYDRFYALPEQAWPHNAGLERVTSLRQALARAHASPGQRRR